MGGRERKANPLAFVVKRTNDTAVRTVLTDTSRRTHTLCENASHPSNERAKQGQAEGKMGGLPLMI